MIRLTVESKNIGTALAGYERWQKKVRGAVRRSVKVEAHLLRKVIVEGLRDQAPGGKPIRPLKPMTIALRSLPRMNTATKRGGKIRRRRAGTKALIRGGDMMRSVTVQGGSGEGLSYTVGVHRGAKGRRGGKDMVDLARIHEYGTRRYTVTVTPRMHRFSRFLVAAGVLHAPWRVGASLRRRVPPRPFLRPGHDTWEKGVQQRFEHAVKLAAAKGTG